MLSVDTPNVLQHYPFLYLGCAASSLLGLALGDGSWDCCGTCSAAVSVAGLMGRGSVDFFVDHHGWCGMAET